jgi:hypothetical protein
MFQNVPKCSNMFHLKAYSVQRAAYSVQRAAYSVQRAAYSVQLSRSGEQWCTALMIERMLLIPKCKLYALFKMVRYVLLPATSEAGARRQLEQYYIPTFLITSIVLL